MIKVEALTLEEAYKNAASSLECSVTELKIEVIQTPKKGLFGLFKKSAIIVAVKEVNLESLNKEEKTTELNERKAFQSRDSESLNKEEKTTELNERKAFQSRDSQSLNKEEKTTELNERKAFQSRDSENSNKEEKISQPEENKFFKEKKGNSSKRSEPKKEKRKKETTKEKTSHSILNDTIMPASFVSTQDDEEEDDISSYLADYDDEEDNQIDKEDISDIAVTIKKEINQLFDLTCFNIDEIEVSVHDSNTLLIEFKGEDAALLIGKEGYRYKALSYMIFNWINTKYQIQLRLEIAEFLKNQEEAISKYLVGVCENINKDGRAQTKILDGVLVQIALKELRERYPDKYIVIRSTRDGLKYIIINDYHSN